MKSVYFLVLSFLIVTTSFSCRNMSLAKDEIKTDVSLNKQEEMVDFSEVRRLNRDLPLKEYMIISTFKETLKLYSELSDKKYNRSEPIPTLEENEFFLLLKPKLKKKFADIKVVKIERKGNVLRVYYKETDNNEYILNKQNDPILILRLKENTPSGIQLLLLNDKNNFK